MCVSERPRGRRRVFQINENHDFEPRLGPKIDSLLQTHVSLYWETQAASEAHTWSKSILISIPPPEKISTVAVHSRLFRKTMIYDRKGMER